MKTKQKKLKNFENGFSESLHNACKERVSKNDVPKFFRRLDSIARLFEGDAVCSAVYYDALSKTLWIANNKVHSGSREKNQVIEQLQKMFHLISDQNLDIDDIIETLGHSIFLNLKQEKRYDLSRLQELHMENKIEAWLKELFTSGKTTKKWCEEAKQEIEGDEDELLLDFAITKTGRLVRDFLKVRDFLLKGDSHHLGRAILSAIQNQKFKILHVEENDVHAEMRLLAEKLITNPNSQAYFGISKLCCNHCTLALQQFNVESRGTHGRPFNWKLPQFLKSEENLFRFFGTSLTESWKKLSKTDKSKAREYIGKKSSSPINEKKNRQMVADSSESDQVFGLVCSSESLEDELFRWPLQQVWSLAELKRYYDTECETLRAFGLAWNEIVDLAKLPQKFTVFTEDVPAFINALDTESGFVEKEEIFEDLLYLYDKNSELFDSIIRTSSSLLEHYDYAELKSDLAEHLLDSCSNTEESLDIYAVLREKKRKEEGWDYSYHSSDSQNCWRSGRSCFSGEYYSNNSLTAVSGDSDSTPFTYSY